MQSKNGPQTATGVRAPKPRRMPVRKSGASPIYMQVADILERELADGDVARALPSEGTLAREFNVSRVTVRRALSRLSEKGMIYSEQGRGYFRTTSRLRGISGFHSFTAEVRKAGGRPESEVLEFAVDRPLAADFLTHVQNFTPEEAAFAFLRRLRSIDGVPVAVEDAYMPMTLYPGIGDLSFKNASLYETIATNWGIVPTWTDALFEPIAATSELARLLKVKKSSPLLAVWRVTLTGTDQLVECVKSVYRGDGFMLNVGRYRL